MSPRRLEPNTRYTAFVIPAFETGRLAGLGEKTDGVEAQLASFGGSHPDAPDGPSRFPYYESWKFTTGDVGDFESLVGALVPRQMDPDVGKHPMDIQEMGYEIDYTAGDGTITLEGALRIPGSDATIPLAYTDGDRLAEDLTALVNLGEDLKDSSRTADTKKNNKSTTTFNHGVFGVAHPSHSDADPVITPPAYGRWHAGVEKLDAELPADTSTLN